MRTELVTFAAADGFPLDGALHQRESGGADHAVLLVHGKTMNFYTCMGRFLPEPVTALGWSCFAINRRGHDLGGIRDSRASHGGASERFGDSLLDIAGAMAELRERGYSRVVLAGHSFGGIGSAAYAATHPEEVSALALCSAGAGGREYLVESSRRGMLAGSRHAETDALARRLVAEGRGDQLIALEGWWYAISAASWVDLSENVPVTVESARRYPGPILALRGGKESPESYPAERIAQACGGRATLAVVPEADHFYNGTETAFAQAVTGWLARLPQ